ncbi:polysaccharide lyase family 4 protein [Zopfia rhizophila CBS 207.26]|uniref:rhamnogalacturonan endolyase n=1 Tax=Zopfia rhizophila CBS 207.26 TaxID=1314779 RepID=A0A6A6E2I3_9PEZI|nr:polysaccharide lyase family 4 protein [Zopfia rhizophila CBS 207.26]
MLMLYWLPLLLVTGAIAISVKTGTGTIIVDTDGDLVVTFDSDNCDMTSIKYKGTEYQTQTAYSHLASGLGSDASVKYKTIDDNVVVSCSIANDEFDLTQYHVFQNGSSTIHLGTDTRSNPEVGELRFIFRIQGLEGAYPTGKVSDTRDGTVIESEDIYKVGSGGETRAKHYSAERFIDDQIHCAYGDVYACFIKPIRGYEASTGGPFYRNIRLNLGEDNIQGVTYYMNHGDFPWDVVRTGFTFIEDLGLGGYIGDSKRGKVVGKALGTSSDFPIVVHGYNSDHQQWVYAKSDGSFESPLLAAGTYTQAFYQDELLAGNITVTVKAGATATVSMTATNPIITESRTKIFQIGNYDGRPVGFLNADKQQRMHVSDPRMGAWDTPTFVVGTSTTNQFPMAIFSDVNNNRKIQFTLKSALKKVTKFRVGTTLSFHWGEPTVKVNSHMCSNFVNPNGADGRGITKGMTHGDMTVYSCEIPVGVLVAGTNTVTLGVTSSRNGTTWLSPNYILDFVELYY